METFRNVCPRNCYGTCGIISHVENGMLTKVTGDPKHGFSRGRLCAKGYAYTQFVYNSYRLKYPIIQSPRGSGNWKRISWDDAYNIIAEKILELNDRYGSNLALSYSKFSGNIGLLHFATEGMFNSFGPHTKPFGNLCMGTGEMAIKTSFGKMASPVPEDMAEAKLIVIWGANPAVTNIHQMKFIYAARKKGAKIVVIDPVFTETALKADLYIQIKPGSDAYLSFGIAKLLLEKKTPEHHPEHLNGWEEYKNFLQNNVDMDQICQKTGVKYEYIEKLAELYHNCKPAATWSGFGIQRNKYGGESVEALNSLAALSGNINVKGGGVYFAHGDIYDFPLNLANFPEKKHPSISQSRLINISNFAAAIRELKEPPVKFLWIASRSPLSQDQNFKAWEELFQEMELIVTVDLYMTNAAKMSDIILPAASHFEEEDLNVGYWHHWLAINEKAIPPYFEAKSDLQIARELTKRLNELSPGFSDFPYDLEPIDWIKKELTPEIKKIYGISSYKDLLDGPQHRKQIETVCEEAFSFHIPKKWNPDVQDKKPYPYRLLSPQSLLKIHSQFSNISWLHPELEETVAEIGKKTAEEKDIKDGMKVRIFNGHGTVSATAKINAFLPEDVILVRQTAKNTINRLITTRLHDENNPESTYFYDSFVDISKKEGH